MSSCIPRHIACGWYNPVLDAGFIAGTKGCTLTTTSEGRARLEAGGTLFRSITFNTIANSIEVISIWQIDAGSPPIGSPSGWIDYNSGIHTLDEVVGVKLTITLGLEVETFYATQIPGSPWISGINELRTKVNDIGTGSTLVTMPTLDAQTTGTAGSPVDTWDATLDDADHLSEFDTNNTLSEGFGPPYENNLLENIRTGPALSLIFIEKSEDIDGVIITPNETKYWNGACWKTHSPTVPDCAGSPPDCGAEPLIPNC